jgi:hypothetical protein
MPRHTFLLACVALLSNVAGCSSLQNVSRTKPWEEFVGQDHSLACDCKLWSDGTLTTVSTPTHDDDAVTRQIKAGTRVRMEKVQRHFRTYLIGGTLWNDVVAVSFEDPDDPTHRIHAKLKSPYLIGILLTSRDLEGYMIDGEPVPIADFG